MRIVVDGRSFGPANIERCMSAMSAYSGMPISLSAQVLGDWVAKAGSDICSQKKTGPFMALCSLAEAMGGKYRISTREGR